MPLVAVLADMERAGVKVDTKLLAGMSRDMDAQLHDAHARDPSPGQGRVQHQLADPAARGALRPPRDEERQEDRQDPGRLDRGGRARGARARARAAAQDPRLPLGAEAQVDLRRLAARDGEPGDRPHPRDLQPDRGGHRAALRHGAEPAEHPDPHARGPAHPPGLRGRARAPAALGRLQPDRAAGARAPVGRRDADRHLQEGRGRPRPHLARDLRRAVADPARRAAPHLQDGQLRSALREERLHARKGHRRLARRGGPVHRRLLRALPEGARPSSTTRSRARAKQATCARCSGACAGCRTCARRTSRCGWRRSGRP